MHVEKIDLFRMIHFFVRFKRGFSYMIILCMIFLDMNEIASKIDHNHQLDIEPKLKFAIKYILHQMKLIISWILFNS